MSPKIIIERRQTRWCSRPHLSYLFIDQKKINSEIFEFLLCNEILLHFSGIKHFTCLQIKSIFNFRYDVVSQ